MQKTRLGRMDIEAEEWMETLNKEGREGKEKNLGRNHTDEDEDCPEGERCRKQDEEEKM